jgi:hypothetical protein
MAIKAPALVPAGANTVIHRTLGRLRPDWCVVKRQPTGVDAGGALVSGDYEAVASVQCRVVAPGRMPTETVTGGRFGPEADYEILMPVDVDVHSSDRITVNGETFEVLYPQNDISLGYQLRVFVKATS